VKYTATSYHVRSSVNMADLWSWGTQFESLQTQHTYLTRLSELFLSPL